MQMILLLLVLFVLLLLCPLPALLLLGGLLLLLVSCLLLLLLFIALLLPVLLLLLLLPVLSLASNHSWHAVGIPCPISSCCLARLLHCCKNPAIRLLMPAANSCCCCACCRILPLLLLLLLLLLILRVRFGIVLCKLHGWYWGSCCCRVLIQTNGITVNIIKLVTVFISMLQHVRMTAAWQPKGLVVSLLAAAAATQTCFHCTLSSNTNSCMGLLKACQNGCRSVLQHTCTYTGNQLQTPCTFSVSATAHLDVLVCFCCCLPPRPSRNCCCRPTAPSAGCTVARWLSIAVSITVGGVLC